MTAGEIDPLAEQLQELTTGTILDVATGRGDFLSWLAESFDAFNLGVGIDSTARAVESARRNAADPRLHFLRMEGERLRHRLDDVGFDWATHLVYIGKRQA